MSTSELQSEPISRDEAELASAQRPETARPASHSAAVAQHGSHSVRYWIRAGVLWAIIGRGLGIVGAVGWNMLLARLLSPQEFGDFLLLNTLVTFLVVLAVFGLNGAVVRFIPESLGAGSIESAKRVLGLAIRVSTVATLVVSLAVVLGSQPIIMSFFPGLPLTSILWLTVGCLIMTAQLQLLAELSRSFREMRNASLLAGPAGGSLANGVFLGLLLAVWCTSAHITLHGAVCLQLLAMGLVWPLGAYSVKRAANRAFSVLPQEAVQGFEAPRLAGLLSVCAPMMMTQLCLVLLSNSDLWILGRIGSAGDIAIYGAARRLVILISLPTQILLATIMPTIPELYVLRRREELQYLVRRAAAIAAVPTLLALLSLLLMPELALRIVYGEYYTAARWPLVILSVGQAIAVLTGSGLSPLSMTGRHNVSMALTMAATVLLWVVGSAGFVYGGLVGMAAASSLVVALHATVVWYLTRRLVGVSIHPLLPARTVRKAERCGTVTPLKPTFYVIGAPKCGTTSLCQYLSEHPQVFVTSPKEPGYWSKDIPQDPDLGMLRFESVEDYLELYDGATERHLARGEGSTQYLFSAVALSEILRFQQDAKFIAVVRNPIELAYAFHGELLYQCIETEPDFETAWRLQSERALGLKLPKRCWYPGYLQYGNIAMLGKHLQRAFALIPAGQLKVFVYDDFARDTAKIYHEAVDFLGLAEHDRTAFPVNNSAKVHRSNVLAHFLIRPPKMLLPAYRLTKNVAWGLGIHKLRSSVLFAFTDFAPRKPLPLEFRRELAEYFRDDVRLLGQLLNRDFSNWLDVTPTET